MFSGVYNVSVSGFVSVVAQGDVLKWCTVNLPEQEKCSELSEIVNSDADKFGKIHFSIKCVNVSLVLKKKLLM